MSVTAANIPSVLADAQWMMADPGNGGALPNYRSGTIPLVTTGAETRTLAAPVTEGQFIALYFKTDAGDCVVTVATGLNTTGNNTITFNDAGELIVLFAVQIGADLRWRTIYGSEGPGLSTV